MQITSFPFQTVKWASIPKEEYAEATGKAFWPYYFLCRWKLNYKMVENFYWKKE